METDATAQLPEERFAASLEASAAEARASRRRERREVFAALLRSKTFMVGIVILGWWIVDAIAWPLFVPDDPQALNPSEALFGPSGAHWLGTDNLGRDVFSRLLAGASSVLAIAPAATVLSLVLGTTIGLAAGYYRGWFDQIVTRLLDAFLAFPTIVLAILGLAVLGSSSFTVILVIGFLFVPNVARTIRSTALQERSRDYVAAARLRGERGPYILFAEILPNVSGPLMVEATVRFGYAVFAAATLSFLGLGVQQPSPDWGLSVALGRSYLQVQSLMVVGPAIALATLVVAINLVVDGLRQVIEE
jgi:peptide/nickel transport system permease protein